MAVKSEVPGGLSAEARGIRAAVSRRVCSMCGDPPSVSGGAAKLKACGHAHSCRGEERKGGGAGD